jgi:hypothetical protein
MAFITTHAQISTCLIALPLYALGLPGYIYIPVALLDIFFGTFPDADSYYRAKITLTGRFPFLSVKDAPEYYTLHHKALGDLTYSMHDGQTIPHWYRFLKYIPSYRMHVSVVDPPYHKKPENVTQADWDVNKDHVRNWWPRRWKVELTYIFGTAILWWIVSLFRG